MATTEKIEVPPPEDPREFRVGDECRYIGSPGLFVVQEVGDRIALIKRDASGIDGYGNAAYYSWHHWSSITLLLEPGDDRLKGD